MAEETQAPEPDSESSVGGVDPVAIGLALAGASREDAREFLKKQGAFIDDQRHHLHEQFKQLRLAIWEKRLGVLLRLTTAMVGLVVAGFLGVAVWNAAHADGLVIDAFSVPPELAQHGITGEVVASRMLDRLTDLQSRTISVRAAQSFDNNWGNDIKVEIPETGVSFGEVYRYLKGSLGHDIDRAVRWFAHRPVSR